MGRQSDDENLPGWLSKEDMLTIRSVMVKQEDVVAVEALDNLYRLDSNYNPPIYTLEVVACRRWSVVLYSAS